MNFKIVQKPSKKHQLYILNSTDAIKTLPELNDQEKKFSTNAFKNEQSLVSINQYNRQVFLYYIRDKKTDSLTSETCRKGGAELQSILNKQKIDEITITNISSYDSAAYLIAEGIALANYQFLKYKKDKENKVSECLRGLILCAPCPESSKPFG